MAQGWVLAVDTATEWCSACLSRLGDDDVVREERLGRGHAERLAPMVREVFEEAGVKPRDVTRIGCTVGPGSFMGVRVGLSFARAFAAGLGPPDRRPPVIGVTSLEALLPFGLDVPAAAVIDARRGEVYAQAFDEDGSALGPAFVDAVDGAARRLTQDFGRLRPRLFGSGAGLLADHMSHDGLDRDAYPSARRVAPLAARAEAFDGRAPAPLYLRAPDAKPQGPAPFAPA